MSAAADRRWCLEVALARHPADDAAALAAAESFLRFLTADERGDLGSARVHTPRQPGSNPGPATTTAPPVGEEAVGLSGRRAGDEPAQASSERHGESPGRSLAHSSRGAGRERDAGDAGVPASDGAAKLRQRAPARADLPLTDGERRIIDALLKVGAPGAPIPEAAARQATCIQKPGPALSRLSALCRKGYLMSAIGVGGRVYRVTRNAAGDRVAPMIEGARVEIRDDLPVPVTVCPPRYARGSVESQYQR